MEVNNYILKTRKSINVKIYKKILLERLRLLKKNKLKLIKLDLRKHERIKKLIINFKPNYIIHLAAVSHANISNKDPQYTFDHSLVTLMNSLISVKRIKVSIWYIFHQAWSMVIF